MGILNGVTPILTDSILLMHIVIDRIEHSKSRLRLIMTMAVPVILKFGRLANAAIYILACAEFVLSSVKSGHGVPDMDILDAAQARSMAIASSLQIIDNASVDPPIIYILNFRQGLMTSVCVFAGTNLLCTILTRSNSGAKPCWVLLDVRSSSAS
jgi:hypothetical protein